MRAIIEYIRMALSLLGKYKKDVQKGYIAAFFESGFTFVPYMLLFYIIAVRLKRELEPRDIIIISIVMLLSVVLRTICKRKQDQLQQNRGLYALTEKRLEISDHLSKLNMGYYSEANIGNISGVVAGGINLIEEVVYIQLGVAVSAFASWFLSVIFLFVFNIKLGLIYLLCSILGVIGLEISSKALSYGVYRRQDNLGLLSQAVLDFIQGLPTIKAFNMMKEKNTEIDYAIKKMGDDSVDHVIYASNLLIIYRVITNALTGLFCLGVIYLLQIGELELAWAIGFIVFSFILFKPIEILGNAGEFLSVGDAALKATWQILKEKMLDDKVNSLKIEEMKIEFKDVSFAYEEQEVLKDINFKIKPHSFTALVGESGSGKSTIASLMARFWDVEKGQILIDGRDIKDYPFSELMSNISMVFQDVFLFNDTIFNNIAFGNSEARRNEVIEAAKKARCHDFIMKLPAGYDTVIGEGGSSLSGGEKQRISIARAMLKDAKLVLLDEATAGVDPDNEKYIQEAIENLVKDKTLVVIAHRLSTIQNADQILVLEDGRIVERGTSEELIKQAGIYKNQYDYYQRLKEIEVLNE
ncbi:MAG: ABC transporter ATP-binding protein [Eubacteriales bacterium]|nr:ABC transporter ATP-binding protein [Eubacteriales bacterium]